VSAAANVVRAEVAGANQVCYVVAILPALSPELGGQATAQERHHVAGIGTRIAAFGTIFNR
jgi:hypothetical protein